MHNALHAVIRGFIPKSGKDISSSQNYRAIALATSLSKVLEHLILKKYSSFLSTSHLQFGFKSGFYVLVS